ncbi:membrane protein [Clostridium novyi A str. 4552]|uniref:Membrane protein n=1 Tax=Clostridium novyi A str. 4552 TaxID=1444289 RepID=A0A0A0I0I0_CLONO|nr:MptD family putative ECF transporter S component [Clostridium novyi]KGM94954.1 membrane protein [Clostridium novyi A str. 4552]
MYKNKGLTIKNMVTIGVFSAIYCVFYIIGGIPFGINPVLTFYQAMGSALLCGPVYMLLVAKVGKKWSVFILGIVVGILLFITGMHWAMVLGCIIMGFIADIIARIGNFKSKKMNIISYMIFSLGGVGSFLAYFINPNRWIRAMVEKGTDQSYLDTMNAVAKPWMIYVIIIGTLLVAAFSAWVGSKLLKKQFEKAGIVD